MTNHRKLLAMFSNNFNLGMSPFSLPQEVEIKFSDTYRLIFKQNVDAKVYRKDVETFLQIISQEDIRSVEGVVNKIFISKHDNTPNAILDVLYFNHFCQSVCSSLKIGMQKEKDIRQELANFYTDMLEFIVTKKRFPYCKNPTIHTWKTYDAVENHYIYSNTSIILVCAYEEYEEFSKKSKELEREKVMNRMIACDVSEQITRQNIIRLSQEINNIMLLIDQKTMPVYMIWRLLNVYIYRDMQPNNLESIIVKALENIYKSNMNEDKFMSRLMTSNIFFSLPINIRNAKSDAVKTKMYKFADCLVREFGKELFKLVITEINRDINSYYNILTILIDTWGKYVCNYTDLEKQILYNVTTFINVPNARQMAVFNPEMLSMYTYFEEQIVPKFLTTLTNDLERPFSDENLDKAKLVSFHGPTEFVVIAEETKEDDMVIDEASVESKYDDITLEECHRRFAYLICNKKYLMGEDNDLLTTVILSYLKYLNVKNFISLTETTIQNYEKENTLIAMSDVFKLSEQTAKQDEQKRKLTEGISPPLVDGNYGECSICMDDFTEEDKCLKCKKEHYIHVSCFKRLEKKCCPMCRENYLEN